MLLANPPGEPLSQTTTKLPDESAATEGCAWSFVVYVLTRNSGPSGFPCDHTTHGTNVSTATKRSRAARIGRLLDGTVDRSKLGLRFSRVKQITIASQSSQRQSDLSLEEDSFSREIGGCTNITLESITYSPTSWHVACSISHREPVVGAVSVAVPKEVANEDQHWSSGRCAVGVRSGRARHVVLLGLVFGERRPARRGFRTGRRERRRRPIGRDRIGPGRDARSSDRPVHFGTGHGVAARGDADRGTSRPDPDRLSLQL